MMNSGEVDERPKVQLGIRLKIPAIRFELPRVSLPKVTISAKIRQPDRPRTINLPEINLDTSSRVVPPGAMGHSMELGRTQVRPMGGRTGGGTRYGSSYSSHKTPSYGHGSGAPEAESKYMFSLHQKPQDKSRLTGDYPTHTGTQSFTFSTDEEKTVPANAYQSYQPMQSAYSSTNVHPHYLKAQQNTGVRMSAPSAPILHADSKDPDAGFDRPTYDSSPNSQYAHAKKRADKRPALQNSSGPANRYKLDRYGMF